MDNEQDRNEHFKPGFARLLWDDMKADSDLPYMIEEYYTPLDSGQPYPQAIERFEQVMQKIIAQRAYDLAVYVIDALKPSIYTNTFTPDSQDEIFKSIPDLTSWPKSQ